MTTLVSFRGFAGEARKLSAGAEDAADDRQQQVPGERRHPGLSHLRDYGHRNHCEDPTPNLNKEPLHTPGAYGTR